MTITEYLTNGGIPDGWTVENLRWLAQAHRRLATTPVKDLSTSQPARPDWHNRWAALIEDVLETPRVHRH